MSFSISARGKKREKTFIQPGPPLAEQVLPSYTILLPLYREAQVAPQLIKAICNLDCPGKRMQVLCVVRPTDEGNAPSPYTNGPFDSWKNKRVSVTTDGLPRSLRKGAAAGTKHSHIQILLLPRNFHRNQARRAPVGVRTIPQGDILVVYDAEDVPAPDQLRLAAAAPRLIMGHPRWAPVLRAPIYASNGATNTVTGF